MMKDNKFMKFGLLAVASIFALACCSNPGGDVEPEGDHVHVYDQQVATIRYRAEGTSCGHAAKYYYSCKCGEPGEETFEYGEAKEHTNELVIDGAKTVYLIGQAFDPTGISAKLVCEKCLHEEEVAFDRLIVPTEPLTEDDTSVTIGVDTPDGRINKTLTITTDRFRVMEAELQVKNNRMYYQITGEYGSGYKTKIEDATLFLTVDHDWFHYGNVHPTCTPASSNALYGTWNAEIDITDICPTTEIAQGKYANVYWPHFYIENDSGEYVNRDLVFPDLVNKSLKLSPDSLDTYQIFKYHEGPKNIDVPVVGKLCEEEVPTAQYYYSATSNTLPNVGEQYTINNVQYIAGEVMYMVNEADIFVEDDIVILQFQGLQRGFESADQFIRATKLYMRTYYKPSSGSKSTLDYTYDASQVYFYGGYDVDLANGTFTMNVNISAVGYDLVSNTGIAKGDGVTTSKRGVRYFRLHTDTGEVGDVRIASTAHHNKSVTVGGRKYTLYANVTGTHDYLNAWQCVGFGIDLAE